MKQNPFSLYDFLGYVFPGLITIYLVLFFANVPSMENAASIWNGLKSPMANGGTLISSLEDTFVLIISAYVVGHLVAYLSSLTVEQFSIWVYGCMAIRQIFYLMTSPIIRFGVQLTNGILGKDINIFGE